MNTSATAFLALSSLLLLVLPRRWAPVPLLAGACFMTLGQGLELGPLTFTVIRILIAVGVVRVLLRWELPVAGFNRVDSSIAAWSLLAIASSIFHRDPVSALVLRLGLVYNAAGIYLLLRAWCTSVEDVTRIIKATSIILAVVAAEMICEQRTNHNWFSVFGSVDATPEFREGRIRASGPFAHSILAGTVGAVNLPLMVALWRESRGFSLVGLAVCVIIIVASSSSSPVVSAGFALMALALWPLRHHAHLFKWGLLGAYGALAAVMNAPVYYLLAYVDLVGGSTGWYRARLIESSIEHLDEWWLTGTDFTRHWMATGVHWSADHADITNYYLSMGVTGGLPLMLAFIATILCAFGAVGRHLRAAPATSPSSFLWWALGASLFAHSATFFSVTYFDQSFVFLYLTIAGLVAVRPGPARLKSRRPASSRRRRSDTRTPLSRTPARDLPPRAVPVSHGS